MRGVSPSLLLSNLELAQVPQAAERSSERCGLAQADVTRQLLKPQPRIYLYRKKINLSMVFAGQAVGIKEVEKKVFGWSALWITISATSTWRKKLCSLSTTLLAQKCYLCSRYVLSPMCPVRTMEKRTHSCDMYL
jgi:hypothetical protein